MRLNKERLNTNEKLEEFDQWLTAKLERIKDSDRFSHEIKSLCSCIESLSVYVNGFSDYKDCSVGNLCDAAIKASMALISGASFSRDEGVVSEFIDSFFNLLFLTTGATDNNLKNHFLIKLKEDDVTPLIPKKFGSKKAYTFRLSEIPSTTKSEFVAKSIAACIVAINHNYQDQVKTEPYFDINILLESILNEYVSLILEDEDGSRQFWAICRSYVDLNRLAPEANYGKYLISSCTIFKVRGSVSASGGHITEDILRDKLTKIGLRPNHDFNLNDVTVGEEEVVEEGKRKKKTRAYDFIIPYNVDNWEPRSKLFIQSQFYAGDSGSVSHKVVDQTQSSRAFTLQKYSSARFVEYLDGAGYYASLKGDLAHMLSFSNTASFFQVKSILVRLRRELQEISFLTPIELEHSILLSNAGDKKEVISHLRSEGYPIEEIERIISVCLESNLLLNKGDSLQISPERIDIARRLLVLDVAANNSIKITDEQRSSLKYLLVPGFGSNFGILQSKLSQLVCNSCKFLDISAEMLSSDIEWLLDEGVLRRR